MLRPCDLVDAETTFNLKSDRIRNGYTYRLHHRERPVLVDGKAYQLERQPWDTANSYFQREAYALILEMFIEVKGGRSMIQRWAKMSKFLPRTSIFSDDPFLGGLFAIDPTAECIGKGGKKAHRFARLFAHADRNRVPPAYLIGFLKQIGGYRTLDLEYRTPTLDPSLTVGLG
jgi:hypothetical protein